MGYDKNLASKEFSRWSESYDRSILQWLLFGPSHRVLIRRIRMVAGDRPIRILDVGCGTGIFASRIRSALPAAKVYGIDLVTQMLDRGRSRWDALGDEAIPIKGDSERLPFSDRTFDFVTCSNSFHHYPHQDIAITEMHRVLRPGGRLLIIDGYRDALWGWFIYDVCVAAVEGDVRHASSRTFRELMTRAGLTAVAQKVYRGFAPFLLNEGVAAEPALVVPAPHFRLNEATARKSEVVR